MLTSNLLALKVTTVFAYLLIMLEYKYNVLCRLICEQCVILVRCY